MCELLPFHLSRSRKSSKRLVLKNSGQRAKENASALQHISISCRRYRHFFLFEVSFDDLFVSKHPVWLFQWGFMQRHGYKLCNFSVTWMKLKLTTSDLLRAPSGCRFYILFLLGFMSGLAGGRGSRQLQKVCIDTVSQNSFPSISTSEIDKVCRSLIYESHWHIQFWKVFNSKKSWLRQVYECQEC